MKRSRGFAMKLLVNNRLNQRLEGRGPCVKPHSKRANAIDQRAKLFIRGAKMLHRLFRIKWQLPAASVVNHKRECTGSRISLSAAPQSLPYRTRILPKRRRLPAPAQPRAV